MSIICETNIDNEIKCIALAKGLVLRKEIAKTLQGGIYLATDMKTKKDYVIKTASIVMHKYGVTRFKNNTIKINENIVKESILMQFLGTKNPVKGFLKCFDFIKTNSNYYLIMEYGGQSLFEYIKIYTSKIHKHKFSKTKWLLHVKNLFKQMVLYIEWLHNNGCCHLDISLENCLIKNNIVYFCDFGLAEIFKNGNFMCFKHCGKPNYQCPEIYKKQIYNAIKADIWCLGVCLVMMLTGIPLYQKASISDPYFDNLVNGFLKTELSQWKLNHAMSENAFDLINKIFKPENQRISIKQILKHPFLNNVNTYN